MNGMPPQMGLRDLAAMGGGGQGGMPQGVGPQGAPPSVQNPGGLGPSFDRTMQLYDNMIAAGEQLIAELKFADDIEAAQIQMVVAKLATTKAKRAQQLQQAQEAMQAVSGGGAPMMG